jgi:hypothetical protein
VLIGRVTVTNKQTKATIDGGVVVTYAPGKVLTHEVVQGGLGTAPVVADAFSKGAVRLDLFGILHVPVDMEVVIWHVGGSTALGRHFLFINNQQIGVVGDDNEKNSVYRIALAQGEHAIGWRVTGGQLGNSLLAFFDSTTGEALTVYAPLELQGTAKNAPTHKQINIEAANPMPKRPPDLPAEIKLPNDK